MVGCVRSEDCDGCGDCKYESFKGEFRIDNINMANDTNYRIRFVNTENLEFILELNQSYVKADIDEFNDNTMKDKSQIYIISGDLIISGSCAPENINKIELKN